VFSELSEKISMLCVAIRSGRETDGFYIYSINYSVKARGGIS
jgi:hypothetical protein